MSSDNDKKLRVALYCSAADDLPDSWQAAATAIGSQLGRLGASLIYGGVRRGLMEIAARAAHDAGAKVVGVVPALRKALTSELCDIVINVTDLSDRKADMLMLADIFVVLPGGYGTLDEFMSTLAAINFADHDRRIIVLNLDGVYDKLFELFDDLTRAGLMKADALQRVTIVSSADEACRMLMQANKKIK